MKQHQQPSSDSKSINCQVCSRSSRSVGNQVCTPEVNMSVAVLWMVWKHRTCNESRLTTQGSSLAKTLLIFALTENRTIQTYVFQIFSVPNLDRPASHVLPGCGTDHILWSGSRIWLLGLEQIKCLSRMSGISAGFQKQPQDRLEAGAESGRKERKDCDHKYVLVTQTPSSGRPKTLQTSSFIAF